MDITLARGTGNDVVVIANLDDADDPPATVHRIDVLGAPAWSIGEVAPWPLHTPRRDRS